MTTALVHPRMKERRAAVEDAETRRRSFQWGALGALALGVLGLVVLALSPVLDIDEVRIIGADVVGPDQVRAVSGVEVGAPLVGVDLGGAREDIGALVDVADAVVTRSWSGVVTIEVTERRRVARIAAGETVMVVAADGVVVDIVPIGSVDDDPSLITIAGAMFQSSIGATLPVELNPAVAAAAALPTDIGRVTEHVRVGSDRLALTLVGGGTVELGDGRDLDAKFDAVRALLTEVNLVCLGSIDVRAPTVPVIARQDGC